MILSTFDIESTQQKNAGFHCPQKIDNHPEQTNDPIKKHIQSRHSDWKMPIFMVFLSNNPTNKSIYNETTIFYLSIKIKCFLLIALSANTLVTWSLLRLLPSVYEMYRTTFFQGHQKLFDTAFKFTNYLEVEDHTTDYKKCPALLKVKTTDFPVYYKFLRLPRLKIPHLNTQWTHYNLKLKLKPRSITFNKIHTPQKSPKTPSAKSKIISKQLRKLLSKISHKEVVLKDTLISMDVATLLRILNNEQYQNYFLELPKRHSETPQTN